VENSKSSFGVKTFVKQECPMSTLLFNLMIDLVMQQTASNQPGGASDGPSSLPLKM